MSQPILCIEPYLTPLANEPSGQDPRYLEAFECVKLEIEKLSGADYALVQKLCHELLTTECKDLRLAGYLCLALVQQHQIEGLLTGLQLYVQLIQQFSKTIHPQNQRARLAAVAWLNSPRFLACTSQISTPQTQKNAIQAVVHELNTTIASHLGNDYPAFNCLKAWLEEPASLPEEESPDICQNAPEKPAPAAVEPPSIETAEIAKQQQRKIIEYWISEKQWLQACQLARAARWPQLICPTPINTQKQTEIQPPRKEALQSLHAMNDQTNPMDRLEYCESLFWEPGGIYFLDLQYHAHQAALQMKAIPLANYLLQSTRELCTQHPALLTLSFSNGQLFACDKTRQWLTEPETKRAQKKQMTAKSLLLNAEKKAARQDLPSILAQLEAKHPQNEFEQMTLLQAKAHACQKAQRLDLALIFFEKLLQKINDQCFSTWFPDEAMSLWREVMSCLNQCNDETLPIEKKRQWMAQLKKNMCLLNSVQTSQWLDP